ncbi:tetraspanin-36-like [Antedon mediterranea]|uniref:tetraspanin-36-like n=1 Tax=Antedon mediterranea TaxID=105859 RepID=UPI003AF42E65
MGLCTASAKLFLTLLGLCFTVAAGCLMYAGIIVFAGYQEYDKIYDDHYVWVPGATIITAGVFMFILGIIACCAACRENKCLLACFFVVLLVIVMMELTGAIVAIIYKGEVKDGILTGMHKTFNEYGTDKEVTDSIDEIQETLECCGVENSTDWADTTWGKKHLLQVPGSCCKKGQKNCNGSTADILFDRTYTEGCYSKVERKLQDNLKVIIGVSVGLLVIQVVGLIFSCVLFCNRKKVAYATLDNEGTTHGYRA